MVRMLAALLLCSCQAGALPGPVGPVDPVDPAHQAAGGPDTAQHDAAGAVPLFPTDARKGWAALDQGTTERVGALAAEYAGFLTTATTPRRAVAGLVALFGDRAAALEPTSRPARTPGSRFWFVAPGGDAAAFVMLGQAPLEQGARIIVASVDAPHIALKPSPVYGRAGVTLFDTEIYGAVELESWLARPLALYLYAARPGAADGPLDLVIGASADDPVLVIPDLEPHLARKVQRPALVDSPERMDAVAARSRNALLHALAAHGVDERTLATSEALLVPADPPAFIGVDRALLAGHGHAHRAFAYAAVRALAEAEAMPGAAVVIVISRAHEGGASFVKSAMSQLLAALTEAGEELDVLDTRRAYARSAALIASRLSGIPGKGVVLAPYRDDAVPAATRRVLDAMSQAGAQIQVSEGTGRGPARWLSTLHMDAVEVAIPIQGVGAPMEILSTLDLYQAWLAATAWIHWR